MSPSIDIRLAQASDAGAVESIARTVWNDVYADIILPRNRERLLGTWYAPEALRDAIAQADSWFFIAMAGSEPVGFAQFAIRQDGAAQLTRIYVMPEWQRNSVGTLLLRAGLGVLSNRGFRQMLVEVEKENQVGRAFYRKHGFEFSRERSIELPEQKLMLEELTLPIPGGVGAG